MLVKISKFSKLLKILKDLSFTYLLLINIFYFYYKVSSIFEREIGEHSGIHHTFLVDICSKNFPLDSATRMISHRNIIHHKFLQIFFTLIINSSLRLLLLFFFPRLRVIFYYRFCRLNMK